LTVARPSIEATRRADSGGWNISQKPTPSHYSGPHTGSTFWPHFLFETQRSPVQIRAARL
jgi:hypothetical protein